MGPRSKNNSGSSTAAGGCGPSSVFPVDQFFLERRTLMVTILGQCHQLLSGGPEACLIVKFGSFQYVIVPTEVPICISTHPPTDLYIQLSAVQISSSSPKLDASMQLFTHPPMFFHSLICSISSLFPFILQSIHPSIQPSTCPLIQSS